MKHLQKSLSLFLCIILCLSFFPFSAYAEESDVIEEEPAIQNDAVLEEQEEIPVVEEIVTDSENHSEGDSLTVEGEGSFDTAGEVVHSGNWGDLNWTLDDAGTLTISGTGPMNDFSSSSAEAWRAYKTDIKKVIIASGVTSIGISAFYDCNALNSVIIPDGVTEIGNGSFNYCSSLESITIPDSVRSIGGNAFSRCNSLTSVTIPNSVTRMGGFPFSACSNLTSINVDPANPSFCDAQGVLYNKGMTIIWQVPGAWSGAYVIPYGVTAIQSGAFYGCKGLTRVSIPDSVTTIGLSAFYNCSSLTDVYYSGTQEEWQQITVGDYNELLTSATIHFLTEPEIIAFGTCGAQGDNLTWTLDNKGTLTISGTGAMQDYNWTGTPPTPPTRPWEDYNNSIIELVVNDGVTALGKRAFHSATNLQRVVLPEGITSLPAQVFTNCRSLSDINFPSSLTSLYNECLFCTGIDTLLLPATVTTVEGHFYGGMLGAASKRFETAPDHPVFSAVDGVLFTKDLSTLVMYPCYDQTTYTVPDGTVKIREHAFAYNFSLETLSIPSTVAFIGGFAFVINPGQSAALHDIYYGGTQEEWQQITVGDYNELLTSATIHFEVINGLVQDDDGVFRYYENGTFVPKTGIVDYQGGSFFVADGVLCSDANGLAEFGGVWYFLSQGQIQKQYSGLAQYDGEWFYIENGILNISKNGLVFYDGGQFLVAIGRICYDVSGLWLNSANIGGDNRWYFLSSGQVQTQYSGVVMYDGAFFVVENGVLNENYNGTITYDGKEFYVKNGQLTGPVESAPNPEMIVINSDVFPDVTFRSYISKNFDTDKDGLLSQSEIAAVTRIDVSGTKDNPGSITSLKGIEQFPALSVLLCFYNQITTLDVSKNLSLTELGCGWNLLTSLDVSHNPLLEGLSCLWNQLTSLDVSNNTALTVLNCNYNQIAELDISTNMSLDSLVCEGNQLRTIDVSNNRQLTFLNCYNNQLASLNVSNNPSLVSLRCGENQLTALNVSNNVLLSELFCPRNQLTSLDVSHNPLLTKLLCFANQLTTLDVSHCAEGIEVIADNKVTIIR